MSSTTTPIFGLQKSQTLTLESTTSPKVVSIQLDCLEEEVKVESSNMIPSLNLSFLKADFKSEKLVKGKNLAQACNFLSLNLVPLEGLESDLELSSLREDLNFDDNESISSY